jgi:2-polyprenyl-3-methyl-5-hydroxy-6-metoxy-1,4-benzoquinol methylase
MTSVAPIAPRTTPPERCPICDQPPQTPMFLHGSIPLSQCPSCGLAWWEWRPFEPRRLYDRDYFESETAPEGYSNYAALEPGVRRTARARLDRIGAILPRRVSAPPRVWEVGCGTGLFLDEARKRGWETSGVEVSPYAAAVARERGLAVEETAAEEAVPPTGVDVVAMWDVVEHLRDPFATIARASAALRQGGILALSTGDVRSVAARLSGPRWHLFNLPEHLFFFSRESLRRLLEANGLRIVRAAYESQWVPLSYLRERFVKSVLRRPASPVRGRAWGWTVPATLCDVLGVYAMKR